MKLHIYTSRYIVPIGSPSFEQGALAVQDGRIVALGPAAEITRRFSHAPCTDYGDSILLPALINAHTHLELSHFPRWQEIAQEQPDGGRHPGAEQAKIESAQGFTAWILRLIEIKKNIGRDPQIYIDAWHTGLYLAENNGTGYIGDILTTPQLSAIAATHLPGRGFIEILGHDPLQVHTRLEHLEHWAEHAPQALWGAAPHAPYTLSQDMLKLSFRTTAAHHLPSSIHLAESEEEVEFLCSATGPMAQKLYPYVNWEQHLSPPRRMRPLECVRQAGGLRPDTLLVHGIHLNRAEIDLVAASKASVVLCPRSNARLKCGKAPVAEYLRAGIPLALGTDSLASNSTLSLWDEMAFTLQWFEGAISAPQLLHMATRGGARALQLNDAGTLAPGKRATFVVVSPSTLPELPNVAEFLCHSRRGREITALYREGNAVDLSSCNKDISA
ncbi:MAG: amidohydrolase family protein [Desulfuromonadaceae bacterium]|nr:amidohydrolase family protein [Desulfuromonas sp.]MDY0186236.1 amidohydrolase family protein [Desulfuromonadaceae bacterium]